MINYCDTFLTERLFKYFNGFNGFSGVLAVLNRFISPPPHSLVFANPPKTEKRFSNVRRMDGIKSTKFNPKKLKAP